MNDLLGRDEYQNFFDAKGWVREIQTVSFARFSQKKSQLTPGLLIGEHLLKPTKDL